jgi:hypothetical protein
MSNEQPATPQSRPAQDAIWLARLQQEGIATILTESPTPPPSFALCLQQLNDGLYFEAHESLETIWLEAPYPLKLFYYALIKLSVGLLQLDRHNAKAARAQLIAALQYLAPFTPSFMGLQISVLIEQAQARVAVLQGSDESVWSTIDQLPAVPFTKL